MYVMTKCQKKVVIIIHLCIPHALYRAVGEEYFYLFSIPFCQDSPPYHFSGLLWKVYCNIQLQFAVGEIM